MTTTAAPQPDSDQDLDLMNLLQTLWAGKWWIMVVALLFGIYGAVTILQVPPAYRASGLLQLETRMGGAGLSGDMRLLADLGFYSDGGSGSVAAEMAVMRSRKIMELAGQSPEFQILAQPRIHPWLGRLPQRLRLPDPELNFLTPYQWGNERIEITTLEVPPDWLGARIELEITGEGTYSLILPDDSRHAGTLAAPLVLPEQGFALELAVLEGPPGREFEIGRINAAAAGERIQGGFAVQEEPPYSSLALVSQIAATPHMAARMLDAVIAAYVEQNIARNAAEAQNSIDFIEAQLPIAQAEVGKAEAALNAYRERQQSVDVDYETRVLLEQATRIEAELNELALREDEIRKRYTTNHPTYQSLLETRAILETRLAEIRTETARLPETQREIFNLTRDLEVTQQIYLQLLNRLQELRVVRASTVGTVRIIDSAMAEGRVGPRTTRTMILWLGLGLLLGGGLVLARRFLRRGIRGAEEIEQMGLPVFGTLNWAPDAVNHRKRRGKLPVHALAHPDDLVVEGLRSLRTALHFGMLDARTRTVLLTSAAPGAGKSFTAINLAVVAAQAGQRVCLIDADLRRGYQRRYLDRPRDTPGLAEYLAQEKPLAEVLLSGPVDGLSVILTGRFPPNPSELLMRAEFEELLKTLDQDFDLTIIDSPPALAVTDSVVIGRYAGAVIMITRHLETVKGEIEAARRAFETAGIRLTGAVLNGYRHDKVAGYGGSYQYYNYRYSYQRETR